MRLIVRENNLEGARKSQCTRRPRARHALSHFAQTTSHYVCSSTSDSSHYICSSLHLSLPTTSTQTTTFTQFKPLSSHYIYSCTSNSHYGPLHPLKLFLYTQTISHYICFSLQTIHPSSDYIHSNHFIHSAETTFHALHLLYTSNSHYVRLYPTLPTTSTVIHPST